MWNTPTKETLNKIPRFYETEGLSLKEKIIHLHFFIGNTDWFVSEYDGHDMFFGFVCLNGDLEMAEWGYFGFSELKAIRIGPGFEVACEVEPFWEPRPANTIDLICKAQGWHVRSHEIRHKQ